MWWQLRSYRPYLSFAPHPERGRQGSRAKRREARSAYYKSINESSRRVHLTPGRVMLYVIHVYSLSPPKLRCCLDAGSRGDNGRSEDRNHTCSAGTMLLYVITYVRPTRSGDSNLL